MTVAQSISIHALLAESDNRQPIFFWQAKQFLSTLSLRRATTGHCGDDRSPVNFYPRSPCGERHDCGQYCIRALAISIHALLAESDASSQSSAKSTPISIHALLAESDSTRQTKQTCRVISIHALLAESDIMRTLKLTNAMLFLSTLSLRRATPY